MAVVSLQRVVRVLGLLAMVGLVVCCGKKPGEDAANFPEQAAKPPPQKEVAPAKPFVGSTEMSSQPQTFEYNAMGKRDPFWSFYKEESRPGAGKSELRT